MNCVNTVSESEENISSLTIQQIAIEGGAFIFLYNTEEDIYSDDDLKVKY